MQRRAFFQSIFDTVPGVERQTPAESSASGPSALAPYTLPLSLSESYHFLRRAGFSPNMTLAQTLVSKSATEAFDLMFGTTPPAIPDPPGTWVDEEQYDPKTLPVGPNFQVLSAWANTYVSLINWWVDRMRQDETSATEKLVLFWSGHFTSEFTIGEDFVLPQLLYRQNATLRLYALGSFEKFLKAITLDPAMLVYLSGTVNVKSQPNENYAREMLELFSCGIGHYSEAEIREAARVLSGWKVPLFIDSIKKNGVFTPYFEPADHDTRAKTFMGDAISERSDAQNTESRVRTEEVHHLIDILFREREHEIALLICSKLYSYYVYSKPHAADPQLLSEMAAVFVASSFDIRSVVKLLLCSSEFYEQKNRGVQVKTAAEFIVGFERQLGVQSKNSMNYMALLEQSLMDPPNVAGWQGYHMWLSTKTYPLRIQCARELIELMSDEIVQEFLKNFSMRTDLEALIDAMTEFLFARPLSAERKTHYKNVLLGSAKEYEWPSILVDEVSCGTRVRTFLNTVIKAPDFHLC